MSAGVDARSLRDALGTFTTGVTIVTTRDASGRDIGLTANSFNSVSLDPPMVLWSLARSSKSLDAFLDAEYFAVHILAAEQRELADLFARRGADKFAGLQPSRGHGEVPLLDGCAARFECRTAFRHDGGDHEIFVGHVITFEHFDRSPLVYMAGRYAVAVQHPAGTTPTQTEPLDSSFSRNSLSYLVANAHYLLGKRQRDAMERLSLSRPQTWALSLLGVESPRTLESLRGLLAFTGHTLDDDAMTDLLDKGLVSRSHADAFALTDAGRALLVEALAVTKATEEHAARNLDFNELQVLRHLLKRLVRDLSADRSGASL